MMASGRTTVTRGRRLGASMPSNKLLGVMLTPLILSGSFVGAATLEVGSGAPYATIQSAITAATPKRHSKRKAR